MPNLKLKPNYFLIPLVTIIVALIGSAFSSSGMQWYDTTLIKPAITPPKLAFPIAWNIIFILTTASALILWNKLPHEATTFKRLINTILRKTDETATKFKTIFWLFIINAVLNVLWSWLFFTNHLITAALAEMIALEATLIILIIMSWKEHRLASVLLWPYAIWVAFATCLTWQLLQLN